MKTNRILVTALLTAACNVSFNQDSGPVDDTGLQAGTDTGAGQDAETLPEVDAPGLDPDVLALALEARACAITRGEVESGREDILTIIDFSRPSDERRLWVLDLETGELLFHELVAHGRNTGGRMAERFSNVQDSLQSSLGLYRTAETYHGKYGRSLRLDGLEEGWNDNMRARAIVMHGSTYVTDAWVDARGEAGRSWGCPALDPAIVNDVIDVVRDGSLIFAYYPDEGWLESSRFLDC